MVKNLPTMQETWVRSLNQENPLEKGMATHSSIFAWRIPWIEVSVQGVLPTVTYHFHFHRTQHSPACCAWAVGQGRCAQVRLSPRVALIGMHMSFD